MTYFVTLDDKKECVGVYCDGQLHFDAVPTDLTCTWQPSPSLLSVSAADAEFAYFYANGKSLTDVCPANLKSEWEKILKRMAAYRSSFRIAKVNLDDNCLFDLIPQQYLLRYCDLKTEIIKHVFRTHEKPENYDFMRSLSEMLLEIQDQKIKLNLAPLKRRFYNKRARDFVSDFSNGKKDDFVSYDAFKTKTGRLSVKKGSFPILNLDKEFRCVVEPTNDWILELDYNAAELRTLLALAGKAQPQEDIHTWNSDILGVSRDEAKKSVISWLYGSKKSDIGEKLSQMYAREEVLNKFYDPEKGIVTTPFGRKIPADDHHALNYLVQSTTADLVFDRMLAIRDLLKDKKSFIKFCLHDSVVIDLAHEERSVIKEIFKIFSATKLAKFQSSISAGRNFGTLKDFNI
jgi:hypothetical protein